MKHPMTRAQRRAQRERIITNRGRLVRNNEPNGIHSWKPNPSLFSKKKPYDCGKAGCRLCHYEKIVHPKMKRLFRKRMFANNLKELTDE